MITMVKADGVAERQQLEAMRRRAAETGAEIARFCVGDYGGGASPGLCGGAGVFPEI